MSLFSTLQTLALVGGAIGGIYAIYRILRIFYDAAKIAELVLHEFKPNDGHTLRDAVDRIEKTMRVVVNRVERIERHVGLDDAA